MMGEIVLISHCNLLNVFSLMWSLSLFFLVGKGLCKQRENFFIEIKIEKKVHLAYVKALVVLKLISLNYY